MSAGHSSFAAQTKKRQLCPSELGHTGHPNPHRYAEPPLEGAAPCTSFRAASPLLRCLRHLADVPPRRLMAPSLRSSYLAATLRRLRSESTSVSALPPCHPRPDRGSLSVTCKVLIVSQRRILRVPFRLPRYFDNYLIIKRLQVTLSRGGIELEDRDTVQRAAGRSGRAFSDSFFSARTGRACRCCAEPAAAACEPLSEREWLDYCRDLVIFVFYGLVC